MMGRRVCCAPLLVKGEDVRQQIRTVTSFAALLLLAYTEGAEDRLEKCINAPGPAKEANQGVARLA
jgi:hypothetical protein